MSRTFSSVGELLEFVERVIEGFGFDLTVGDKGLGRDCAGIIAEGIQRRSVEEKRGATQAWDDNAPEYKRFKEKRYGVFDQPNVRTGQMLSLESLSHCQISRESVSMIYGTGDAPAGTTATGAQRSSGDTKTDREKAHYAHAGQSQKKIKRPFFELDEQIADDVQARCQQRLNEYLDEI